MSGSPSPYPPCFGLDAHDFASLAAMEDYESVTLTVGQQWTLTAQYQGPGFNGEWIDPYLIVVANGESLEPRLDVDLNPRSPLKVGITQFEQMPILLLRSPALGTIDIAHPWIEGMAEPETIPADAHHILWQLVIVQEGHITSMHAFTTNAFVARAARRIFAEQRAHGPLNREAAAQMVDRWREATVTEKDIWRRSLAECKPGE